MIRSSFLPIFTDVHFDERSFIKLKRPSSLRLLPMSGCWPQKRLSVMFIGGNCGNRRFIPSGSQFDNQIPDGHQRKGSVFWSFLQPMLRLPEEHLPWHNEGSATVLLASLRSRRRDSIRAICHAAVDSGKASHVPRYGPPQAPTPAKAAVLALLDQIGRRLAQEGRG
jgi:hypothetical protein